MKRLLCRMKDLICLLRFQSEASCQLKKTLGVFEELDSGFDQILLIEQLLQGTFLLSLKT
jgi:hypothetical protein